MKRILSPELANKAIGLTTYEELDALWNTTLQDLERNKCENVKTPKSNITNHQTVGSYKSFLVNGNNDQKHHNFHNRNSNPSATKNKYILNTSSSSSSSSNNNESHNESNNNNNDTNYNSNQDQTSHRTNGFTNLLNELSTNIDLNGNIPEQVKQHFQDWTQSIKNKKYCGLEIENGEVKYPPIIAIQEPTNQMSGILSFRKPKSEIKNQQGHSFQDHKQKTGEFDAWKAIFGRPDYKIHQTYNDYNQYKEFVKRIQQPNIGASLFSKYPRKNRQN